MVSNLSVGVFEKGILHLINNFGKSVFMVCVHHSGKKKGSGNKVSKTEVTICNHQADSSLYVWPDV